MEKIIKQIFNDFKYHSIKTEGDSVIVRFNDMTTFNMGALLLDINNILYVADECRANIIIN